MPPKKFNPKKASPDDIIAAIKSFDAESRDLKPEQILEAMNQCIARGNVSSDAETTVQTMFDVALSSNIFTESQMQKLSKSLYKADTKKAKAADKKSASSGFLKDEGSKEQDEEEGEEDEEDQEGADVLNEDEAGQIMMSDRNFKKILRDLKESDREARFHILRDKLAQPNPNIGQLLYLVHTFGIFQDFSVDEQAMMRDWSEKQVENSAFTGPQVISMFLWCPILAQDHALVRRVLSASLQADNMGGIVALTRVLFFSPLEAEADSEGGSGLFKGDGSGGGVIAQFLADRSLVPDVPHFILSYLESLVSMRQEHRKASLITADALLRLLSEYIVSQETTTGNTTTTTITQEHTQRAKVIFDKGRWHERPHSFHRRMKELFGVFVEKKGKGGNKSRKTSSRK